MSAAPFQLPPLLPPLRENLQLFPAARERSGAPTWVIQDPISNRFYRIGWLEFELLSRWKGQSPAELLDSVRNGTPLQVNEGELTELLRFLQEGQLLDQRNPAQTDRLIQHYRKSRSNPFKQLLHNYLFFRLPLVRPTRFLRSLAAHTGWLYQPATLWVLGFIALFGLGLTVREWDQFIASFQASLSPAGLVGYLLAIMLVKSIHELGHALTATHYGLRVSHMGVAFVVLWPMLYTDTSEAWRLQSRRQRLAVDSAGIIAELGVAAIATLAWHLTANSDLKQIFFFLATTSWVLTLAINTSPFMRFDGYFIASDFLELPNLHQRSFAVARTVIRRRLLGLNDADPEPLSPALKRFLLVFALITWLYRLVVFIGIAVAVYYLFFKLLGILLFIVEISWFVLRPVWSELKVWYARRAEVKHWRKQLAWASLLSLLLLAALPLPYRVEAYGVLLPVRSHTFYSPLAAQLKQLPGRHQGTVEQGETVFQLSQPELQHQLELARIEETAVRAQLQGLLGFADGEQQRRSLQSRREVHASDIEAYSQELARLTLSAPFAGVLTDLDPHIAKDVWVDSRTPLATLIDPSEWIAEVFVEQSAISRVQPGAQLRFYSAAHSSQPLSGTVQEIDPSLSKQLPHPMLSARFGGPVAIVESGNGLQPRDPLYRVRVKLNGAPTSLEQQTGRALIDGMPTSWLADAFKPALIVLIRESGF